MFCADYCRGTRKAWLAQVKHSPWVRCVDVVWLVQCRKHSYCYICIRVKLLKIAYSGERLQKTPGNGHKSEIKDRNYFKVNSA